MKVDNKSLLLYLVTDRSWLREESLISQVEKCLINGVTFLQLREKNLDDDSFLKLAVEMKELSRRYNVPFVINDNIDIALKSNADGVHIGQDDMPIEEAKKIIGGDKILGVSVGTVDEAILAEKLGADYLGVGAIFSTSTKKDARNISYEALKEICESVSIPVVAIGGINKDNIEELRGSGIDGVAVISAILAEKDIAKAANELKDICNKIF
ncbi:thiamine-phosphate diphosphorylase [Maledivibacter halophilus]|uniref:Thiamine-phosphate synthase n=1 Tax=Maledivibacter halophilus TaxID=36842 RepID=A0A1T5LKX4_9FIRM|nr:thiamine phosphate synthase [Maledivibacter halophilus]SKC76657.1 thiamine-phosphate diphosphorylase [Maledivibacter halophilus]